MDPTARALPPPEYQWHKDGVDIPGATRSTLPIPSVNRERCGTYVCSVRNRHSAVNTVPAVVSLRASVPVIRVQPVSTEVAYGGHASLTVKGALCMLVGRHTHAQAHIPSPHR